MNFTLHTEPRSSVPEFTISCHTHRGSATTVQWTVNGVPVQGDRYHETSQLILDTSLNSVYDNRLRVRGRRNDTRCGGYRGHQVCSHTQTWSHTQHCRSLLWFQCDYFSSFHMKDHYVFCYEVLADFVERMEAYHNFKTLM